MVMIMMIDSGNDGDGSGDSGDDENDSGEVGDADNGGCC